MAVDTLAAGAAAEPVMRARLLETIAGNTARLEEMVRDLLDLSRLESPESVVRIEPVVAGDLADVLRAQFEGICAERSQTLVIDLGVQTLRTDRALVLVILRNLVENATKFAYEGTAVRVTGRPDATGGIAIEVADRGIGIPIQHQQRVFERYYQVDSARTLTGRRRGSGLGLAIVKHAVRRLGGAVRLTSVWKEGTTVTVELPAAAASSGGEVPAAEGSGP
jgi:signal transduction histidine kinase